MVWSKVKDNDKHRTPKANTLLITSIEFFNKTQRLLVEFGSIPIIGFACFWQIKYDEVIDFTNRKYDGGLTQFLRDNSETFELFRDEKGIRLVALKSRPVSRGSSDPPDMAQENLDSGSRVTAIAKQRVIASTARKLFNEACYLWQGRQDMLRDLNKKDLHICFSAYENALKKNHTVQFVNDIRRALSRYPYGIKLTELYRIIDLDKAYMTFGVAPSPVGLVFELPEIFYLHRANASGRDLVFDGSNHTISDLTGRNDGAFKGGRRPEDIVADAINRGLYARTLLLIREAGQIKGLKINVWQESLKNNFYPSNGVDFKKDVAEISPLTYFLALARYDMIELKSGKEGRNDIRAYLPRRYTDLMDLRKKLTKLNVPEAASESSDTNNDEQSVLEPQDQQVKTVKLILTARN